MPVNGPRQSAQTVKRAICLALWRMARGKRNSTVSVTMSSLSEVLRQIGVNASDVEARIDLASHFPEAFRGE